MSFWGTQLNPYLITMKWPGKVLVKRDFSRVECMVCSIGSWLGDWLPDSLSQSVMTIQTEEYCCGHEGCSQISRFSSLADLCFSSLKTGMA